MWLNLLTVCTAKGNLRQCIRKFGQAQICRGCTGIKRCIRGSNGAAIFFFFQNGPPSQIPKFDQDVFNGQTKPSSSSLLPRSCTPSLGFSIQQTSVHLNPLPAPHPHKYSLSLPASSSSTSSSSSSCLLFSLFFFSKILSFRLGNRAMDINRIGVAEKGDRGGAQELPKFKSLPPPSLPLSPLPISPSSFLGLSELLDSPVLFSNSNVSSPSTHQILFS